MNQATIELILGRKEDPIDNSTDLEALSNARILITGGNGSIGREISKIFEKSQIEFLLTDVSDCDVTNSDKVYEIFSQYRPTHVIHLAADKHAPEGELHPDNTFIINTIGSMNVIKHATNFQAFVVLASTCKSCDPETAYGASKLLAERITLNAGGTVARFFNVVNTSGNVFEIWDKSPENSSIEVADCSRYFISLKEATSLILRCAVLAGSNPGRYIFDPGIIHHMPDIAQRLYPENEKKYIPPRRGDRRVEPLKASSETLQKVEGRLVRVSSPHDFQSTK